MSRVVPSLSGALLRFPVPASIAVLATVYVNIYPAQLGYHGWPWWGNDLVFPSLAGLLPACAAHYFARSRHLSGLIDTTLAIIAGCLAAMLVYWDGRFATSTSFLIFGLSAFLPISGSLRADVSQAAAWRFAFRLAQAALLAIAIGLLFRFALTSLPSGVYYLTTSDLQLSYRTIVTSMLLVTPLVFLALIPDGPEDDRSESRSETGMIEHALPLTLDYVLVPVVFLYAIGLHIYAVQAMFGVELPDGFIAWLIMLFVGIGTASWILAWPWRETGSPLLRLFVRYWGWLTIVPLLLLVWVTWERIAALGLMPERYGLLVGAVWLASAAVYWIVRREKADIRPLLGGFAMLMLIASFGPWGARNMSATDQAARLSDLFKAEKVLASDGTLTYTQPVRDQGRADRIGEILSALYGLDGLDKLKPLFQGRKDDPFAKRAPDGDLLADIRTRLKIDTYIRDHDDVKFNSDFPVTQDIDTPNRLIGPVSVSLYPGTMPQGDAYAESDGRTLFVTVAERKWEVALLPLMQKLKAASTAGGEQAYIHEVDPSLKLVVSRAFGIVGEEQRNFSMVFWLILPQ